MNEEIIKKWIEWMEVLRGQFSQLLHLKEVFEEVRAIIQSNPALQRSSSFYGWLQETYATTMAIGVRRIIFPSEDAICLIRFLNELKENPQILNRDYYKDLYPSEDCKIADQHFDKNVGVGKDFLSTDEIENDRKILATTGRPIKEYADAHIAHIDPKPPENLTTWNDLNESLKVIEKILRKYICLLTAGVYHHFKPAIQEHWKAIFEIPWIKKPQS